MMTTSTASTKRTRIGLIGLGNMGFAMGGRLAEHHDLLVHDANDEAVARFVKQFGAKPAESPRDFGCCSTLILMLPNGVIVRDVMLGQGGVAEVLPEGSTVIDMSSSAPSGTKELAVALADKGVRFVDAPVSGGVKRAANGTLAVMIGGDPAVINDVKPVLSLMGTSLFHAGPIGAGHAMKALNNYVSAAGLIAACEAVEIARRFGIEPETAIDALNSSSGKNNSTENKMKPFVISGAFNSGFSLGLMHKDLKTALELASECGVDAPLAGYVVALWADAEKSLGFAADHTEIARMMGPS